MVANKSKPIFAATKKIGNIVMRCFKYSKIQNETFPESKNKN